MTRRARGNSGMVGAGRRSQITFAPVCETYGNSEEEGAPVAQLALDPDAATMRLDDALDDGQPQAGAGKTTGGGAVELIEAIPDMVEASRPVMPMPVSPTSTWTALSSGLRRTLISPPSGLNLMALPRRLSNTCPSRLGSPYTERQIWRDLQLDDRCPPVQRPSYCPRRRRGD